MIEGSTCPKCGYTGPQNARYCAYCGRAFVPSSLRLISATDRLLASLSRRHILWFGLAALFLVSFLAHHLIVGPGLFLPVSLLLTVLIFAVGAAYLGWGWNQPWSGRGLFVRAVVVFAAMAAALAAVLRIDRLGLSLLSGTGRMTVFDIPGIHAEVLGSFSPTRVSYEVADPPPYWLLAMIGALLVGAASSQLRKTRTGRLFPR
jgi:hypothetical protein